MEWSQLRFEMARHGHMMSYRAAPLCAANRTHFVITSGHCTTNMGCNGIESEGLNGRAGSNGHATSFERHRIAQAPLDVVER